MLDVSLVDLDESNDASSKNRSDGLEGCCTKPLCLDLEILIWSMQTAAFTTTSEN